MVETRRYEKALIVGVLIYEFPSRAEACRGVWWVRYCNLPCSSSATAMQHYCNPHCSNTATPLQYWVLCSFAI